jgi:hypothetical protein
MWIAEAKNTLTSAKIDVSNLQNNLNDFYASSTSSIITIPNSYLKSSSTYNITFVLTNFLFNKSSTASTVVQTQNFNSMLPQVYIYDTAGTVMSITSRAQPINLFASVILTDCTLSTIFKKTGSYDVNITYEWFIYSGYKVLSNIQSKSTDKRYFKLLPYTLQSNTNYTVKVSVSIQLSSLTSSLTASTVNSNGVSTKTTEDAATTTSASQFLQIGRTGVVSIINGGLFQTTSIAYSYTIDASSSYDIDYPTSEQLTFQWFCVEYSPNFGSNCPSKILNNVNLKNIFSTKNTYFFASSITFPSQSFVINSIYNISVLVQNTNKQTASTYVLLQITKQNLPLVSIEVSKNALNYLSTTTSINNFNFIKSFKFNADEKIVLTGLLQSNFSIQASWSSKNIPNFPFYNSTTATTQTTTKKIATTPIQNSFESGFSSFQLGIEANSLLASQTYEFQLKAAYSNINNNIDNQQIATASILIVLNSAPSNGYFTVTPATGYLNYQFCCF